MSAGGNPRQVDRATELAFSPSGRRLGSAGEGNPTRIWEPPCLRDDTAQVPGAGSELKVGN